MSSPSFFSELKRRNLIRMAGLYLVGAWLLTQVGSTVLPMFGAPGWLPRSVVILLAIGFVPALIFGWVFELTPVGLKRDEAVPVEKSIDGSSSIFPTAITPALLSLDPTWNRLRTDPAFQKLCKENPR